MHLLLLLLVVVVVVELKRNEQFHLHPRSTNLLRHAHYYHPRLWALQHRPQIPSCHQRWSTHEGVFRSLETTGTHSTRSCRPRSIPAGSQEHTGLHPVKAALLH